MKVTLSQYAGFCDGVKRAYEIVKKASEDPKVKGPIFVLDSLVHNEEVVKKIEDLGIKKINFPEDIEKFFGSLKKDEIGTLIITAHGVGPRIYELAKERGIDIIDTTCPKVMKVQRLAKLYSEKNFQVIVIGEKDHKEVRGIYEWSGNKAFIIQNEKDLKDLKLDPSQKIVILSQTTQNQKLVEKLSGIIGKKYPKAESINTLCLATENRQSEVRSLAKKNEAVIVIGSPTSANSTHLWEIAKEINPRSYFIEKSNDIRKISLENIKKVGISAGASTPSWTIEDVLNFLGI